MAIPELNEDILALVCACLTDVSDVLAISLTCSSVRRLAIKQLLSLRPIYLSAGDTSIQRFHYFLFADAPARSPLIRALDIETRLVRNRSLSPHHRDASLLIDILVSCKLLKRISFGRITFPLPRLTKDPNIIAAIASVQSLRSLVIQTPSVVALDLISKARAPLRKLVLWCFYGDGVVFNWCPPAFQQLLSHLVPTLEELSFHELIVDPERIQGLQDLQGPERSFASWIQYPAVYSLSVHFSVGRLLLEPLQHLFPAVDGTFSVECIDYDYPADTFSDIRAANQRAQDRIKNGDGARRHVWTKLRRLTCPIEAFYILGLRCPIDFAMVDGMDWTFTPQHNRRWLAVSLRENPVPRLTLCLALDDKLEVFDGVFGPELGAVLTHLTLVLDTVPNWTSPPLPGRFGWDELLDKVHSSLGSLHKVTHLRVVIYSQSKVDAATDLPVPLTPSRGLARAVHPSTFEFQGTAAALARPLPSLRFLSLNTCGRFVGPYEDDRDLATTLPPHVRQWAASRAWSVAQPNMNGMQDDSESELTFVELGEDTAERIIEQEELILPDECMAWFSTDVAAKQYN